MGSLPLLLLVVPVQSGGRKRKIFLKHVLAPPWGDYVRRIKIRLTPQCPKCFMQGVVIFSIVQVEPCTLKIGVSFMMVLTIYKYIFLFN